MGRNVSYNSKLVKASMYGFVLEDGLPKDTLIQVDFPEQAGVQQGADGTVIFFDNEDYVFPVTVNLLPTSLHHDQLGQVWATGNAPGPFSLVDGNGSTALVGTIRIRKPPTFAVGNEPKVMTWLFDLSSTAAKMVLGGQGA